MAGDVVSSSVIDDAWFVGALATIAAHPLALMQNLFVTDVGPETDMDPVVELDQALLGRGSCVCRFYVEGEWQEVKVDSLIPTRRVREDDGIPMDRVAAYGRSRDPSEHWVSIEKAYAKLYRLIRCASWRDVRRSRRPYGRLC